MCMCNVLLYYIYIYIIYNTCACVMYFYIIYIYIYILYIYIYIYTYYISIYIYIFYIYIYYIYIIQISTPDFLGLGDDNFAIFAAYYRISSLLILGIFFANYLYFGELSVFFCIFTVYTWKTRDGPNFELECRPPEPLRIYVDFRTT